MPPSSPANPSAELLERAREGDSEALEELVAREQHRVYRFGLKMCRNAEDAKEVLQETLLAMARGVADFRGGSSLSTWLFTIARSHCLKKRRRSKYAPAREDSLEGDAAGVAARLSDGAPSAEDAIATKELDLALESAIGALDPKYREVLLLRDVEGLTAPEVGEVLGITPQAVKSRLHRARMLVRARMAPMFGPSAPPAEGDGCPNILSLFSKHLEHEISSEVCREMESHVATCARCRERCDSLKRTLALCRTSAAATTVPEPVQADLKLELRRLIEGGNV